MMADPVSHTAMMSWMTEELAKDKPRLGRGRGKTNQITLFPEPAGTIRVCQTSLAGNDKRNARFPWIHKREPVDFHLMIIWPSKSHAAVPLCWAFRAML